MTASSEAPLWQWTAGDIASATRSGELSCVEVVSATVLRMREVNPRLNAVTLDLGDEALARAAQLDRSRLAGEIPGPLFGVPVTIKDNVDVRGQRTPNGVPGLAHIIAPDDSPVVKNLIDAGAVIIGRTNAPEFSMRATTNNPLYGLTINPWDERISCGGSSGGAGVSVAAGLCALAHGNDIGGSIRFPALHCGVAGLKPSLGRVPAYLPSASAERPFISSMMSVQGPLARSVSDLRLGLVSMSVHDPRDPWWVPAPLEGPPAPSRIGLIDQVRDLRLAPEVRIALDSAAHSLRTAGYEVEPIDAPDLRASGDLALRLLSTDMFHHILPVAQRLGSDQLKWYFDIWFKAYPAYDDMSEYLKALMQRNTLARQWALLFERHPVVLVPQRFGPLLEVDEDLRSADHLLAMLSEFGPSITFNLLGLPAVMVPTGLHNGLPQGVQLIASRFREDLCLAAAHVVEGDKPRFIFPTGHTK